MKRVIFFTLFAVSSLTAFACEDFTGTYLCPETSDVRIVLGGHQVTIKKSPILDIYSMKTGDDILVYEKDSWNPAIDPNTGDVDHTIQTMAQCFEKKTNFKQKVTEADEDISVTMEATIEVTPRDDGIKLRYLLDSDEMLDVNCKKQ